MAETSASSDLGSYRVHVEAELAQSLSAADLRALQVAHNRPRAVNRDVVGMGRLVTQSGRTLTCVVDVTPVADENAAGDAAGRFVLTSAQELPQPNIPIIIRTQAVRTDVDAEAADTGPARVTDPARARVFQEALDWALHGNAREDVPGIHLAALRSVRQAPSTPVQDSSKPTQ